MPPEFVESIPGLFVSSNALPPAPASSEPVLTEYLPSDRAPLIEDVHALDVAARLLPAEVRGQH